MRQSALAAQAVDADLVVLDPVAGRSAFVGDDVGVDVGAAGTARSQPVRPAHPGVEAEVAPGALAPFDRDAPERVAPGPHRRLGDARATRGERRHAPLVAAGQVELVDRAALVEETAGAARVHRDDRPGAVPGPRSMPTTFGNGLIGASATVAVDAQHQPLHLAPSGHVLAQPRLHAAVGDHPHRVRLADLDLRRGGRDPRDEQRRDGQPHAASGSPAPRHRRRRYQRRVRASGEREAPRRGASTRLRPPRLAA